MEFYTNGIAKPNPGEKYLAVTDRKGKLLFSKKTGRGTSNEAEYEAVIEALKIAQKMKVSSVVVYTNSALLINHMKGVWEMNKKFKPLVKEIRTLCNNFSKSFIAHKKSGKNLAKKEVKRLTTGDKKETSIEVSDIDTSLVSVPINLNAPIGKRKSGQSFSVMVDYQDDILNVYVDPDNADLTLVEAVLKAAMIEMNVQRMHATKVKMKENGKEKGKKYIT